MCLATSKHQVVDGFHAPALNRDDGTEHARPQRMKSCVTMEE